jgi:heme-degrading monooxygenase HmoA
MSAGVGSWATIFKTRQSDDTEGYEDMAVRMAALVDGYDGFLGMDSARGDDGVGITVCYWEAIEAIEAWGRDAQHREAQKIGLERWYDHITMRIAKVEQFSEWDRPDAGSDPVSR